jgi:uncharacterized protein YbjT (DUF2867 family)
MHVLLTGATGLIGGALVAALERRGHRLTLCVRDAAAASRRWPGHRILAVDFVRDVAAADWGGRLPGVDVVVNSVGILREHGDQTFDALHVRAPVALFEACAAARVRHVVQLSALGADDAACSRYHRSKRQADRALAALPVRSTIVRPSLVFAPDGASTRLFTLLATLPVIPLPGRGAQCIQPVHIDDLVAMLVGVVEGEHAPAQVDAVGAQPLRLRDYLATLRGSLQRGRPRFLPVPRAIVRLGAALGEYLGGALPDREALQMLDRGNCADASTMTQLLGHVPRAPAGFIAYEQAGALCRAALLRWLLPLLRLSVALVWLVTGVVSLGFYPVPDSLALLARVGLGGPAALFALYGAALLDLALGIATLALRRRRALYAAQAALILGYTAIITVWLPEFWLHPYGPVLKNLPLLAALWLLHALDGGEDARSGAAAR